MTALITKLVKAEPHTQDGQAGYLMTYDAELPAWVSNPSWIPVASMEMLKTANPVGTDNRAAIDAALLAGA